MQAALLLLSRYCDIKMKEALLLSLIVTQKR